MVVEETRSENLRQVVHLLCGGGAFLLYYWPAWAVLLLLAGGAMLGTAIKWYEHRNSQFPGPLFRPGEGLFWNGASTYALGVGLAVLLLPPMAASIGWLVLAVGDSFATLVGKRVPLVRFRRIGKSLGGILAFVIAALPAVASGFAWWGVELNWDTAVLKAGFAGALPVVLAGAIAELPSRWVDDNLTIPLAAGSAAYLVDVMSSAGAFV